MSITTKLTVKRERFAHYFVQKGSGPDAYELAFNVREGTKRSTIRAEASKLLADPAISQRIAELREKVRKRHNLTMDDILAELDENRDLALREKQSAAATQATMGKAKVGGFMIDKVHVDVTLRGIKERMRLRKLKETE